MPQLVELADGIVNRVEVEVRGDVVGVLVVGRVLHRAEIVNLHPARHNNHAARVLAGGALDAGAAGGQAQLLRAVQHRPLLLGVFADKADGRFIRHGGDGTGLKHVVLAEQRFRVAVGVALILAGEVQVDIRRFVAVEAQKRFKRNGVAVAAVFGAADGALLGRQVKARAVAAVRNEFAVLAVRADIMRRQRVYL